MTTINSVASMKALSALDIMDVAGDCILAVGDMMRDLRRANLNPTSEVWGMLDALQRRFIGMKEGDAPPADDKADAQTYTVAYTPEGKDSQAVATFEKKVDEPVASNDITQRRNDFLVELASRKNMSRNGRKVKWTFEPGAKQFIGGDDYATVLDSLVHDGLIVEFKVGRGTFYRLPVKETVPVIPAPAAPTVPAPVASADEIPEAFDNGEPAAEPIAPPADDKPVKAKKTRKSKAAPKQEETSPIANASDDDKREFVAAIIDMAKQKGMVPTPDNTAPSADAIGAAFLILGKRVSALDTVKAKKAVKLIAELRGLLS
jgi:hypothetical protein